jgi:peroxiredoxin
MGSELRKNWVGILLSVIVVLMGLEIISLVRQNRQLRSLVAESRRTIKALAPGDTVPSFVGRDIYGNTISIQYTPTQPHTLLVWFSASCPACEDNLSFWNELYQGYSTDLVHFLGMGVGDSAEIQAVAADFGIKFPVVCANDPFYREAYRGNVYPQTLLISPEGVVRDTWVGSLQQEQKDSIITALAQLDTLSKEGR